MPVLRLVKISKGSSSPPSSTLCAMVVHKVTDGGGLKGWF